MGLFVIDDALLSSAGLTRAHYLRATLEALNEQMGGALVVRHGEPASVVSDVVRETGARDVVATRDFGPAGRRRDERVAAALRSVPANFSLVDSPYVVEPGSIRTKSGTPCRVFGAFQRGWFDLARPDPYDAPRGASWVGLATDPLEELTDAAATRAPSYFGDLAHLDPALVAGAGEVLAREQLEGFASRVASYGDARDAPGVPGTSRLSAPLHFGALHPRTVLAATAPETIGDATFARELCWREFYADVLFHRPDSAWRDLQPSLAHLRIDRDHRAIERFRAWALGQTGYPLVDAGMRQLLEEGWMHNRVRMVSASFLVKNLHLDWRWGAKWFLWRLVDADLASNQHGWQWVAGTGTDAAPFHRVFNPTRQAQRFDPEGVYVRRYVGELRDVAPPQCLEPGGGTGLLRVSRYCAPMVDADAERVEALARFAEARRRAKVDP